MDFEPHELMRIHRMRKHMTQEELAKLIGSYQVRISRLELSLEIPTEQEKQEIEKTLSTSIWPKS